MMSIIRRMGRRAAIMSLTASTLMPLAACTPDLASFDDSYVPQSVEENYPIKVVEKPVRLQVVATAHGVEPADANEVIRFARRAATRATTPVTIAYASGSKSGRKGADQTAQIMTHQGVNRKSIVMAPYGGWDNVVTLTVGMKVAETKPCGDWSQNLRGNQFNDSGPNFGCAVQQNMAAMVSDPQDLEHPKPVTPAQIVSQSRAQEIYNTGTWTIPVVDPNGSFGQ